MSAKEQVYVVIKDEETRIKALQVLIKHDQNSEDFKDFKKYQFLKFTSYNKWITSDYPDNGTTEISVERLDEILSQSKSLQSKTNFIWLKDSNSPLWLMCFDYKNKAYYGYNSNGVWYHKKNVHVRKKHSHEEEATLQEVSSVLIEEATKRGFKKGLSIISPNGIDYGHDIKSERLLFSFDTNTLFVNEDGVNLFHDGNWAELKEVNHEFKELTELPLASISSPRPVEKSILQEEVFNPQTHYDNSKGSLYKIGTDRKWNPYLFDVVKRLERGGKKDPLKQEIEKSIDVLKIWLIELNQ